MSGSITFNPFGTTTPTDSFLLQTQGFVQGVALDDPSARMELAGGFLDSGETVVMWGGVPIEEMINLMGTGSDQLGPDIKRASSQASDTGWSVFNQAGSMVITPGITVPVAATGNYVAFFRTGTQQRICVQCDPALTSSLTSSNGDIASQALYWDVTNYRITLVTTGGNWALPTATRLLAINTNSKIVNYNSGTKAVTWTTGHVAVILI